VDASAPEAVAQFFAASRFLSRDFNITRSAQVWNTDESMINAQALMETTPMTVVAGKGATNPEFVFPSVHSGAEAASLIPTVFAGGTRLPLFVIVAGSGVRLPYAVQDDGNGKTCRVPLVAYREEGAEVDRREKPGFDGDLWDVYTSFSARGLAGKCPSQGKVLLMDGCKVHASVIGIRMLKASKVVVLMFPSHLSHILQALDSDPFLKANAYARAHIRGLLPTLPRNFRFNCVSDCSQFATRDPPVTARQWYTALRHNVFVKVARRSSSRTSKGSTLRCFRVDNYISWFRQRVPVVFQHVSVRNFLQATIG